MRGMKLPTVFAVAVSLAPVAFAQGQSVAATDPIMGILGMIAQAGVMGAFAAYMLHRQVQWTDQAREDGKAREERIIEAGRQREAKDEVRHDQMVALVREVTATISANTKAMEACIRRQGEP